MDFIIFPFQDVSKGERIAIYGAGQIYQMFKQQIDATNYCEIAWVIDKSFELPGRNGRLETNSNCYNPSSMDWSLPDKIVVASLKFKSEIVDTLKSFGIDANKLVTVEDRHILKVQDRLTLRPNQTIWKNYYKSVESGALAQYKQYIEPILNKWEDDICFDAVLDFACGEGRIAELFKDRARELYLVDAGEEAIEYCNVRFEQYEHVRAICNFSGAIPLEHESVSLIYSWDAMVHFSYKLFDFYLSEFHRIIQQGGYILIHHSNLASLENVMQVYELWSLNPESRSNISKEDIAHLAKRYNLEVVEQYVFDWGVPNIDCITVLKKPINS